jgi:hypothetical protein
VTQNQVLPEGATVLKISGACAILSPLLFLGGVPLAAGLQGVGGPGLIAFGDGEMLTQLAAAAPRTIWIDAIALIGPMVALLSGAGWHLLAGNQRLLAAFGTLLWYIGISFIIAQDAIQLAVVTTLPAAYVEATELTKPAIEAFGATLAYVIEVLASVGVASGVGFLLVCVALLRAATVPRWIPLLGAAESALGLVSNAAQFAFPQAAWPTAAYVVGLLTFILIVGPALGVVMWRRSGEPAVRREPPAMG